MTTIKIPNSGSDSDLNLKTSEHTARSRTLSPDSKIFIAGHRGMVGSAMVRRLQSEGYTHLKTCAREKLDLTSQAAVREFFQTEKIDYIILAAAKVGGIYANSTYPAEYIYDNIMIEANVINEAYRAGIQRLIFLGSSCIYPKSAPQPMKEEHLLTAPLEPTNEPYGIAKIAGIKLCESYNRQYGTKYRAVMPTNLYGPNDNFNLNNSHVVPALMRKFHEAKINQADSVEVWGTGEPRREFLHVDDMASACVFVMSIDDEVYDNHTQAMLSHINVGTGKDIKISKLAEIMKEVVGFKGNIVYQTNMPDGTPRKLLDVSLINAMGWKASMGLHEGISLTYEWFKKNWPANKLGR
jgi:GDP-L-fucose synthase